MAASSGIFGTTKQVVPANAGACLYSLQSFAGSSTDTVITLYHGTAATAGNEIKQHKLPVANTTVIQVFKNPIACPDGIFATVAGTGSPGGMISYDLGA